MKTSSWWVTAAAALAAMATPAHASPVSARAELGVSSAWVSRGVVDADEVVVQPALEVAVELVESDSAALGLVLATGASVLPEAAELEGGASLVLALEAVELALGYAVAGDPGDPGAPPAHELGLSAAAPFELGPLTLTPGAELLVPIEPGATHLYGQAGVEVGAQLWEGDGVSVGLAVPVEVGLTLAGAADDAGPRDASRGPSYRFTRAGLAASLGLLGGAVEVQAAVDLLHRDDRVVAASAGGGPVLLTAAAGVAVSY